LEIRGTQEEGKAGSVRPRL